MSCTPFNEGLETRPQVHLASVVYDYFFADLARCGHCGHYLVTMHSVFVCWDFKLICQLIHYYLYCGPFGGTIWYALSIWYEL